MNLKKVILNKKYICKLSFRLTAIAFSFLGFIGTFVSLADLVPAKWNVWFKLLFSFAIFCGIWIISFLCCALVFSCKIVYQFLKQTMGIMSMWNMVIY